MTASQDIELRRNQREIAGLLSSLHPFFQDNGYQGTQIIDCRVRSDTRWGYRLGLTRVEPVKGWHIDSVYRRSRYLGTNGAMYTLIGNDPYGRDKLYQFVPLDNIHDEEFLQRSLTYLGRLARAVAPSSVAAGKFEMLGQVINGTPDLTEKVARRLELEKRFLPHNHVVIIPRVTYHEPNEPRSSMPTTSPEDTYQAEKELRCEDPSAGAIEQPTHLHSPLATREQQIRYVFLSWLHLITSTGWSHPNAHPTAFFQPEPPYAHGGPIHESETARLIDEITDAALAKCVDSFSDRNPPWHLVLTERGMLEAKQIHGRYASPERTHKLLKALLRWIGQYAKEPLTIDLSLFLSSVDCEISGMTASATEVYRAARWLANRGYLTLMPISLPIMPAMVSVTREGVKCLDLHEGDVMAMQETQRKVGDQRTYNFEYTRDVVIDSHHFTQGNVSQTSVDIAGLVRFAEAVSTALPALRLEPSRQRDAEIAASEIMTLADTSKPDHGKLDALGRSLRAILEGTASNVVAAALLKVWSG